MLIDSHAHLTDEQMDEGLEEALKRAGQSGIDVILNIATNPQELKKGLRLQEAYLDKKPRIYNIGSTTPHDAEKEGELYFEEFAHFAKKGSLLAIGETGLDYHYYKETSAVQKKILKKYLNLAKETHLPVVIHCREAFEDFFQIIDEEKHSNGVLHCFTGTLEEAGELIKRDWYLSLSGIVTYKKSEELRKVAKWVPMERLLIETDAPYLAPQAFRGKKNEPAYLVETARCIAEIRNMTLAELGNITSQNAKDFFRF